MTYFETPKGKAEVWRSGQLVSYRLFTNGNWGKTSQTWTYHAAMTICWEALL